MSEIILSAQGVHKRYEEGPLDVSVLQGVDLAVSRGQSLAIVGQSGSGKSTLLHVLGGLDLPTQGRVTLMARDWAAMSPAEQGQWRNRHLGFVYQFHHLLPEFSAVDNVAMPLLIRREPLEVARRAALAVLGHVGLGARAEPLYAPALLESAEAVRTLLRETSISRALASAAGVELALVGIGSTGLHSSPHLLEGMRLSVEERRRLEAQHPVGDVCGRFVAADGTPLGPPTSDRVLAVTFPQLARIPEVLAVAAGAEKAPGVSGVLRSGVIDTVVLDADLARAVLTGD